MYALCMHAIAWDVLGMYVFIDPMIDPFIYDRVKAIVIIKCSRFNLAMVVASWGDRTASRDASAPCPRTR